MPKRQIENWRYPNMETVITIALALVWAGTACKLTDKIYH